MVAPLTRMNGAGCLTTRVYFPNLGRGLIDPRRPQSPRVSRRAGVPPRLFSCRSRHTFPQMFLPVKTLCLLAKTSLFQYYILISNEDRIRANDAIPRVRRKSAKWRI